MRGAFLGQSSLGRPKCRSFKFVYVTSRGFCVLGTNLTEQTNASMWTADGVVIGGSPAKIFRSPQLPAFCSKTSGS